MGWHGPILTDSGGFQVISLGDARRTSTTTACAFRSHLDGSRRICSRPEDVVEIAGGARRRRADAARRVPRAAASERARAGGRGTHDRLGERSRGALGRPGERSSASSRAGSTSSCAAAALRWPSREIFPATRWAGSRVGEPARGHATRSPPRQRRTLPPERPRYLMGMGTAARFAPLRRPWDMTSSIASCRRATERNGTLFTPAGQLNIRNAAHARDPPPARPRLRLLHVPHLQPRVPAPSGGERRDARRPARRPCTICTST